MPMPDAAREYQRNYAGESLIAELTELLALHMKQAQVNRRELAQRLGVRPRRIKRLLRYCDDVQLLGQAFYELGVGVKVTGALPGMERLHGLGIDCAQAGFALQQAFTNDTLQDLAVTHSYLDPIVEAAYAWRDEAVRAARTQGSRDVLLAGIDTPWPFLDVLARLIDMGAQLHDAHTCGPECVLETAALDEGRTQLQAFIAMLADST